MPGSDRPRGRRSGVATTSWDPIAEWYQGWVGEAGSKHHRQLAIPAVMDLLQLAPGERLLDVGCGHGVLASHVLDAGAEYTGVDASPRLVAAGQATYRGRAQFVTGDARRLVDVAGLRPSSFDAVVFLLSLQDMDPLDAVIGSAAAMLRTHGRLVILMTHPAFRIPRQSGWGWDESRKLRYRRVDAYLSTMAIPLTGPAGGRGHERVTRTFHRPLGDYVNELARHDLLIDAVLEIPTYKVARGSPAARAENLSNREIPLFLGLRAVHVDRSS